MSLHVCHVSYQDSFAPFAGSIPAVSAESLVYTFPIPLTIDFIITLRRLSERLPRG